MKKATRKLLAVILTAIMILAVIGCKSKDSDTDTKQTKIKDPTPTPTPVVTMEDLFEVQKENFTKYSSVIKAVSQKQTIDFPNFNMDGDFNLDLSIEMSGYASISDDAKANGTIAFKSSDDTAYYAVEVKADSTTNGETSQSESSGEAYIENDKQNDIIRVYRNANDEGWKLVEKTISELLEQDEADNENPDGPKEEYFKDIDDFLKAHTTMEITSGAFKNTTSFTIQEFREHYKADIDSMMNSFTDAIFGSVYGGLGVSSGSQDMMNQVYNVVLAMVTEMVNGMTGEIKIVQEFDAELEPTVMTLSCKDINLSTVSQMQFSLKINEMVMNLKNKEVVKVEIPDDVKRNAVPEEETGNLLDSGSFGF